MKIDLYVYDDVTKFYARAEIPTENAELVAAVRRTKKPNKSWCWMANSTGLFSAWFVMPNIKGSDTALFVHSGDK